MGIYDRPWYQEESRRRAPSLNPVVKGLLIANVAMFVIQLVAGSRLGWDPAQDGLGLVPDDVVRRFMVWQLVTSLFLHGDLFHLLFNMLVLWMFGSFVERALGPARFLRFYLFGGIVSGLLYVISQIVAGPFTPAVGASGAIMAVLIYFTMMNPNATIYLFMMFPMRMKWAALLIVSIDLFYFLRTGSGTGIAHSAHLGGALFGFLYYRYSGRLSSLFSGRSRPRDGGGGRPPPRPSGGDAERRARQAEVDRLLEKIHEGGIDSLSSKERDFLREASRRAREEGS